MPLVWGFADDTSSELFRAGGSNLFRTDDIEKTSLPQVMGYTKLGIKMKHKLFTIATVVLTLLFAVSLYAVNVPRAKQASLIESVSPTEITVRAKGTGYWETKVHPKDKDNYLLQDAIADAKKSAIWWVLFGGTDPMLTTADEKNKFAGIEEEFFDINNIQQFIAWEGDNLLSRTMQTLDKDKKYQLHIEKAFKINKEMVANALSTKGVMASRSELADALGLPFIMVIPAVPKGQSPIAAMQRDANLSHAGKVIEGYLTAKRYDVVVPEQQANLSELTAGQMAIAGTEEDYSYQLALSIGSDVYITYEITLEDAKFGAQKAVCNVRAYETTTARLLGTETGYSPAAQSSPKALIENAVNDAIDKVLARISAYWKEDMGRGIQFKVIISISPNFSEDDAEEVSFVFSDLLEEVTMKKKYKENIVTKQTLDYLLWCDPAKYDKSTRLYRDIKKKFDKDFSDGVLKQININRKLVLLKVEPN